MVGGALQFVRNSLLQERRQLTSVRMAGATTGQTRCIFSQSIQKRATRQTNFFVKHSDWRIK